MESKTDQPTMEIAGDQRRSDQPSSTEEVARDLENRKGTTGKPAEIEKPTPLFPENEATNFRNRWTEIQAAFVDEPRRAVEQADALVADVIKRLASSFADERSKLEGQWGRGDNVSTEDLRVALQRYRAFFDRLLSV
ncbi:MAG TPA: hypothetical protein VE486_05965 [Candidatus Baltobacteraceae bacterium]|jgi:hypothetical protein|nr:hypothetical protein [Candidatus Baltobacteraceae bacterium]